ncbi:MAG: PAS domain-containing protein [Alphaproteobacteria bacterium]|nr:PAS domain-containing protein [Alphaproteobacteria bacterium]
MAPMSYPRTQSLDFLAVCSPRVAAIHAYWDRKRDARPMPARSQIDPTELKPFLPGITLVDVGASAEDMRYRLMGTANVASRGYDPTGQPVAERLFGRSKADILENYRRVVTSKQPLYDGDMQRTASGFSRESGTIYLPLSTNGKQVDMILIYVDYADAEPPGR